jgi:hypothetical protein
MFEKLQAKHTKKYVRPNHNTLTAHKQKNQVRF